MVFRQQPFEGRLYRIEFDFLCFLKVNIRQHSSEYGCERDLAIDFYTPLTLLARGTNQEVIFHADDILNQIDFDEAARKSEGLSGRTIKMVTENFMRQFVMSDIEERGETFDANGLLMKLIERERN